MALFLAIALGLTAQLSRASDARVADLRCEYLSNPICVESTTPRLSWKTICPERDWTQAGYQILVASDAGKLARDQADLWDTGEVRSPASIQVPYNGKRIDSRQSCCWKVRVWDASGLPTPWSRAQTWSIGLLRPEDWKSCTWIGRQSPVSAPAPFLRKAFGITGKVRRAVVYASGLGYAELHLNGRKLGETTERDPGYTDFDKRVLYVAHDVTKSIRQGNNVFGAVLGTGWYDVHDIATWQFQRAPWRGRPRLRLMLFVDYVDGRSQVVASDSSWKSSTGPILTDGIYTGEFYDARKEMPGWDAPGFDDRSWNAANEMPSPKGVLAARICPPVAVTETIKAARISEPKPGVYIVDFGQNIAGHVRLNVKGPAGSKITMRYSERVRADGMIERSQIDVFMAKTTPPQPFQTDSYICKGIGTEHWEQRFSYSGFRYAEVTGFPGKPQLSNFEARMAGTDFESAGAFASSNDLLNKIQRATRYSYRSNAQSIPTDCPQREKNGWTGDAQLAAEAGLMNFKSSSFYTKWLNDLDDNQQPNGALSVIVPTGGWGRGGCNPAWDSAYPIVADDLYRYSGDASALERHYNGLRKYVDFLSGQTKDDVVTFDSLGDWVPWQTQTPSTLTSTVFLFVDARIVAKAARLLGKQDDARRYQELSERVKTAFVRHFVAADSVDRLSQTALSMAIYFELLEGRDKVAAMEALLRNLEKQGHLDTGILGAKFVLRALSEAGRTDLAYRLVSSKQQPGWGWWIDQGATTLWEDWKGESSLNHIMFGDVSNWFYQWIAGIGLDPSAPAFKHILLHPQPVGDLTWASATENGPYGNITSSWRRRGDAFHWDIEVPPNSSATVWVPGEAQAPENATHVRREAGTTVFDVGSGSYTIESQIRR